MSADRERKMTKLKGWCYRNKKTGVLDPLENMGNYQENSYGLFPTKKELIFQSCFLKMILMEDL